MSCIRCAPTDGICRCRYRYEGPNGSQRDKRDYSPDEPLRATIGDLIKRSQK